MGELKMAGLTRLTMEAYQELSKKSKVEQVSDPLTVVLAFGKPVEDIVRGVEFQARDYPVANAYMGGLSRQTEEGLVTPFVLYKVSE